MASATNMKSHTGYAEHLFDTGLFSDCTVYCGDRIWHLHRSVLAQRCSFFRACFSDSFKESVPNDETGIIQVNMHDDEPQALNRMLRWLYTLEYPHQAGVERDLSNESRHLETSDYTTLNKSCESIAKDEGYLSDSTVSEQHQQSETTVPLPKSFWTSEMSLFAMADKYDLKELADQALTSIHRSTEKHLSAMHLQPDHAAALSLFDDFIDMLEVLYADLPATSTSVRQLQQNLISCSAMTIAAYTSQQPRYIELMATAPLFAADLVETLRKTAETHASVIKRAGLDGGPPSGADRLRSSRSSVDSTTSLGSLDSDANTARRRTYIPMNEDSDTD